MIALRKKAETTTSITLEWDSVPGAVGYRFQSAAQPKWSHTFDANRRDVKFSKAAWYKVEALGKRDSGQYPTAVPPPSAGGKHVSSHHQRDYQPGLMRYGEGDYLLCGTWAGAQARQDFPGLDIYAYASAVTCSDSFFTGLSGSRAIAAGYALRDLSGNVISNGGYGGAIGDPGDPAYQAEWAQTVIAEHKGAGVYTFIDDIVQSSHIGNAIPVKYPTQASWRAAMVAFISAVGPKLKTAGKVMLNTGAWYPGNPTFDDGRSSIEWATTLGPFGTSCMIENGFQTIDGSNTIRTMGAGWTQNWDGWAKVITAVEAAGADYVGVANAPAGDSPEAIYLKASGLLFMNRPGSSTMFHCDDLSSSPFGPKIAKNMGAAKGPAVLSGQTWTRNFDNGSVSVNPWNQTASITLT